jgi:hypothetical protein
MGAEKTDEELMLAYAQGDVRAFDALYQRQRGMLYRFICAASTIGPAPTSCSRRPGAA